MDCKIALVAVSALFSFSALADDTQCNNHFSVEGSYFSGKTYKTWAAFPKTGTNKAYKAVYAYTVKDGWQIGQADKELGIISASQAVSYGKGKTVPLNIIVEQLDSGSKVTMTYATPGGVSSPEDAVKAHFCKTLAAVK